MKLPYQPTAIACICQQFRDKRWMIGPVCIAIAVVMDAAWVHASHEARAARGTNRALAIRPGKRNATGNKFIQGGGLNIRIAQGSNRVKALLIGAVQEDVGAIWRVLKRFWHDSGYHFVVSLVQGESQV